MHEFCMGLLASWSNTLTPLHGSPRVRGNGEVIKREEFEERKEAAEQARQARLNKKPKRLASQGKNVEDFPLLQVGEGRSRFGP